MEIREAGTFLPYWRRIRERTRRLAVLIPPDQLEWTHKPGKFTLGDLVRHLAASERYIFTDHVLGRTGRYPGHGPDLAQGHDAVLGYLDRMHAESVALLETLTPEQLGGKIQSPAGQPITAWKWLRAMVEHEVHHRGQLYLMLGMLDVPTPPLYGLTEEEVLAAARGRAGA